MKSLTLDDVYHDYDTNHKYNISCEYQGDNKITKTMISYNPKRKIRRNIYENLKVKHYIKIKIPNVCFDFHQIKYKNHFSRMDYKNCFYCRL